MAAIPPNPPRVDQVYRPEVPAQPAQPAVQEGAAGVPDRLDALQALSCCGILEMISNCFYSLVNSCLSCFKGIGIALGLVESPEAQRAQEAARVRVQETVQLRAMVDRWVIPYNTRKEQAVAQAAAYNAKEQAEIRKLAHQIYAQVQQSGGTPTMEACSEQAAQFLSIPVAERNAQQIAQLALTELAKELQIAHLAELVASDNGRNAVSVTDEDRQKAQRIVRAPINDQERTRCRFTKLTAEGSAAKHSRHAEFLERAKVTFKQGEINRIAREMADQQGGNLDQYLRQAEDHYEGRNLAPKEFDPSWAGYEIEGNDHTGDAAAALFWAEFQALPEAVIEAVKLRVAADAHDVVNGFQLANGLSPVEAIERVIKSTPNEMVFAELQAQLRARQN